MTIERRGKDGRTLSSFQHPEWMAKIASKRLYKNAPRGEKSGRAKLDRAAVIGIRKPDTMPRSLAEKYSRRYNISVGYVYQLRRGIAWGWLK